MGWNPDRQAIEQERQRWVYEEIDRTSLTIQELVRGPDELYAVHREAYEQTGNLAELRMMLEYVR